MTPVDEAYKETRRMLAGLSEPAPAYAALIEWIKANGGNGIINVVYETLTEERQRLDLVFESEADVERFCVDGTSKRVVDRFREILAEQRNTRIVAENLFAVGFAFETAARIEANWKVTGADLAQVRARVCDASIWLLRPQFEYLTVFFNTDDELRRSETSGVRAVCATEYARVIVPYDEFGCVARRPIELLFDSRENFERKYGGSWFAYDR